MSGLPKKVRLTEVGPRDGLQNESDFVPTDVKVAFIRALLAAGLRDIEVSSFVRHDVVPQLRDAAEVFEETRAHSPLAEKIDTEFQSKLREIGGMMAKFEVAYVNQRNRVLGLG